MVEIGLSSDQSDTDEESTIQQIISQAQDSILLQQISAINCSSFTHSDLPTDLESRFLKLKSFPANHTNPPPYHSKNPTFSTNPQKSLNFSPPKDNDSAKNSLSDSGYVSFPLDSSHVKKGLNPKPIQHLSKAPTFSNPSSSNPQKSFNFSPPKENNSIKKSLSDSGYDSFPSDSSHVKKGLNPKPKSPKQKNGSFSPSDHSSHTSEESSMSSMFMPLQMQKDEGEGKCSKKKRMSPSPSPPRKWGCFWCSPKKEKKKGKENVDIVGWEECTSDEFLSDIGSLSSKKRLNMIDKALKEEQKKISREAEKIIEYVKHASGRMNVSDIEDDLSDD